MLKFKAGFVILGSLVWFFSSIFRTKSLITGFMGNWVPCRIAQECAHLFAANCTSYPKDHSLQATITPYRLSPADCFGFTCWEGPLMTIGPLDDQRIIFDPVWSFLLTHLKIFKVSNPMLVDKWSGVRPALSPRSTNRSMSLGVGAKEVGNYVDLSHHQSATRDNPWCEP